MYRTKSVKSAKRVTPIPPSGVKAWPDSAPTSGDEPWRTKQRRVRIGAPGQKVFTVGQLIVAAAGAWCVLLVLFLAWWRPYVGATSGATALGLLVGLGLAFSYYSNVNAKLQRQQVLSMDPGLKGCQFLLGTLPSWISLTEREKMEWLNRLLSEMWPYYDRGVCAMVKEIVEPIMEQYRPPVFKRIFFQELTFGEAPVRIEGISVKDSEDEIDLEVDVRWSGDANISLGIELPAPAGASEYTRITPKVRDIVFVATMKIILKPLVEKVPGFAAVAVALKAPPIIRYRFDFGVLPGAVSSLITAPLINFVNFIVNEVIVGMLLWPKRFTVPVLSWDGVLPAHDPEVDLEVERLNGRQRGVIKVAIIQAKELNSYDAMGKSDPLAEIYTTPDQRRATRHINNTLAPEWNETKYLPVFEKDQVLYLEVFDHDNVNLTNLTSLKEVTNQATLKGSKEFMGRAAIPLAQFIAQEGLEEEFWVPIGRGEWTNVEGPGQGEGWVKLGLQYRAVENIGGGEIANATAGLLLVGVIRCWELAGEGATRKMSTYVQVKVKGGPKGAVKQAEKTPLIKGDSDPRWAQGNKMTLYDVTEADTVVVSVMEPSLVGPDAAVGTVELRLRDVAASRQVSRWTGEQQCGYVYRQFPLQGAPRGARAELELEFLPYW